MTTPHSSTDSSIPRTIAVAAGGSIIVGRDETAATVVIAHPSISRKHAGIRRTRNGLEIMDLGSTNGIHVNGRRLAGAQALKSGDVVALGPLLFRASDGGLELLDGPEGIPIQAADLTFDIRTNGTSRRLVDRVNLAIPPGSFVAVIGPSGCGKSSLIRLLSGRVLPTSGDVRFGDLSLAQHFSALKHTIGFVPQRETLPEELPVISALRYTARLRLAADSRPSDIEGAVRGAIRRVGLEQRATLPINKLSGGQRKRVALANELIAQPKVIFADEVTSGLDDGTDREMMQLFKQLAGEGVSIICVTHTIANVDGNCDALAVMAPGGRIAYYGPPRDVLGYFGIASLAQVYEAVEQTALPPTIPPVGAVSSSTASRVIHRPDKRRPFSQLPALVSRTIMTTTANARNVGFIAAQSILVGLLFRLVFGAGDVGAQIWPQFAFLLGVSSFWFGCSNASKEIVKERGLYRLERNINLRIPSYVLSKLIVVGAVVSLQVVLLHFTIVIAGVNVTQVGPLFAANMAVALVGVALGLVISAIARKEDQAAALVPIALIPQLLLSGAIVPDLSTAAEYVAQGIVSAYWMFEMQMDILDAEGLTWGAPVAVLGAHLVVYTILAMLVLVFDKSADD